MAKKQQSRAHAGHSHSHGHGHSHAHDNTYLLSTNTSDAGVRITRIGLYVNLGMAIVKGIGGYVFNSKALIADAFHSLTDLVSDFMTLATVSLALKPPSERFPNGYGKVESLGSLGVSGMLLFGGCMMGYSALLQLGEHFIPGFAELAANVGAHQFAHDHSHHGHDHGTPDLGPNINAIWLAGGSILIKEWLYRATLKVAKERKSSVLASNAYHHRVDSLTAFVALLTIAGSNILSNASWMDPVGGLIISLMVIQAGLGNTRSAILELADVGMDSDTKRKIARAAMRALEDDNVSAVQRGSANGAAASDGTVEVRQVLGTKAGQSYLADVELGVPKSWTVAQTSHIEELVRARVGAKVRGVKKVGVRFVAVEEAGEPDFKDEFIAADVSPRSSPEPESEDEKDAHGHDHPHSR